MIIADSISRMQLFGSDSWLYIIFIGFVVGVIARFVKPGRDPMGLIMTTLLGIAGALVSGYVGQMMGWYKPGQPANFFGALLGAIALLMVFGLFRNSRNKKR